MMNQMGARLAARARAARAQAIHIELPWEFEQHPQQSK